MPIKSGYEYRIKKQTMGDGSIVFRPQRKVGNDWFELPASQENHGFLTELEATREIQVLEKHLASFSVVREEYIPFN